jgi:hypothetical protein
MRGGRVELSSDDDGSDDMGVRRMGARRVQEDEDYTDTIEAEEEMDEERDMEQHYSD